jgi:hypothetical protein
MQAMLAMRTARRTLPAQVIQTAAADNDGIGTNSASNGIDAACGRADDDGGASDAVGGALRAGKQHMR